MPFLNTIINTWRVLLRRKDLQNRLRKEATVPLHNIPFVCTIKHMYYIWTHKHTHTQIRLYILYKLVSIYVSILTYLYVHTCVCVYMCVCPVHKICVYVFIYVCAYKIFDIIYLPIRKKLDDRLREKLILLYIPFGT